MDKSYFFSGSRHHLFIRFGGWNYTIFAGGSPALSFCSVVPAESAQLASTVGRVTAR